jgi:RHS repeat-associated protein
MLWDANGNLAQQTVYSVNNNVPAYQNMRALYWDEDDRLNLVARDGYLSYYAYGHDGNRAIKMTGNAAIDQTGTLLNSTNLENVTIYPNEYLTVTQAEYTKYYYAGGNRIASKIGTGGFEKMTRLCTEDLFFSGNANTLFGSVILQVTNTANQPNDEYPVNVCGGYNVATELLTNPLPDFYISQTNLNFTQNNLLQQFRQNLTGGIEAVYYFHSDHLGSASWITSGTGAAVQHLLYLPFGEHFVNERNTAYDERFTFTGKERDAETGYYYHGARFNSSDIGWLSVDPMADKYPSISPYAYCAWNPVKLVDEDGREITDPPTKKEYETATSKNKHKISKISWGETSGLYPTKNVHNPKDADLYNTENWDEQKTEELLKARAAIHFIGTKRNSIVHKSNCVMKGVAKKLATFHLITNFPNVDAEILNDEDVKYFYLSPKSTVATPSINAEDYDQKCVKTYGPFYNNGGGDVPKGPVYIHFYKAIKKENKNSNNTKR